MTVKPRLGAADVALAAVGSGSIQSAREFVRDFHFLHFSHRDRFAGDLADMETVLEAAVNG
jgi:hypothetical protein